MFWPDTELPGATGIVPGLTCISGVACVGCAAVATSCTGSVVRVTGVLSALGPLLTFTVTGFVITPVVLVVTVVVLTGGLTGGPPCGVDTTSANQLTCHTLYGTGEKMTTSPSDTVILNS